MTHLLRWIRQCPDLLFLTLILLLHLKAARCQQDISLSSARFQNGTVVLECTLIGDEPYATEISLGCDIQEGKVCRKGCAQVCSKSDDQPNCTGAPNDGVVGCELKDSTVVVYVLEESSLKSTAHFWCLYGDKASSTFTYKPPKKKSKFNRSGAMSRSKRLKSAKETLNNEPQDPNGDAAKMQKRFNAEAVFIIAICTLISLMLNLVFCVCCQVSRKYLNRLSHGGYRNLVLEKCLCIKGLADTYKLSVKAYRRTADPRRATDFYRGGTGSLALWRPVATPGALELPLTEPTPRRKPLSDLAYFPSVHADSIRTPSIAPPKPPVPPPPPPQKPVEDEVIYDDVHQSTIYNTEGNSQQNIAYESYLPGSLGNEQRCIVDQNGMVYVAMGHVSQTPKQLRANLAASRVTLTTFQPDASPRWERQELPSRKSSVNSIPSGCSCGGGGETAWKNGAPAWPVRSTFAQGVKDMSGLPPQPVRTKGEANKTPITPQLNPPVHFADNRAIAAEDDFDDLFEMADGTLVRHPQENAKKTFPNT